MSDPRENCPWKCNHCLCYQGEIERLTIEVSYLRSEAEDAFNVIHDDPSEARRILFRALRLDLTATEAAAHKVLHAGGNSKKDRVAQGLSLTQRSKR